MKAVVVRRFGGPEVLGVEDVPEVVAEAGSVVVEVHAAEVLFVETQIRAGLAEWFPARPPWIPGLGAAGVVRSVGPGVSEDWIGRRVAAATDLGGAYAEQVAVAASELIPLPESVSFDDATALLHDGRTALGLIDSFPVHATDQVLVTAAAGGAGLLLLQLARAAGARVAATARGKAKLALAREAGADIAIDHSIQGWPEQLLNALDGARPTVVFDGVGGQIGREALEITADGGRFSAHGAAGGAAATGDPEQLRRRSVTVRGIEQVQFSSDVAVTMAARAITAGATGLIHPVIGQHFPLAALPDAHRALTDRTLAGKAIITLDASTVN